MVVTMSTKIIIVHKIVKNGVTLKFLFPYINETVHFIKYLQNRQICLLFVSGAIFVCMAT